MTSIPGQRKRKSKATDPDGFKSLLWIHYNLWLALKRRTMCSPCFGQIERNWAPLRPIAPYRLPGINLRDSQDHPGGYRIVVPLWILSHGPRNSAGLNPLQHQTEPLQKRTLRGAIPLFIDYLGFTGRGDHGRR